MTPTSARPARILVAEDSPANLAVSRESLLAAGYDVIEASHGSEVMARVHREHPDLVVLDTILAERDGLEILAELRAAMKPGQFLPVILLTDEGGMESKLRMVRAGANDFMTRPVEPEELLARVEAQLRTRRLHDELAEANRQLLRERDVAGAAQRGLAPAALPRIDGLDIATRYDPNARGGGDYCDVAALGDGRLAFVLADVTGWGIPAVLHAATARAVFHAAAGDFEPARVLRTLDQVLKRSFSPEQFMTACVGALDPSTGELLLALAGFPLPILLPSGSGDARRIDAEVGLPLGIAATSEWTTTRTKLDTASRLLLHTDGLATQRSPEGVELGRDRVCDLVGESRARKISQVVGDLVLAARLHGQTVVLRDDVAILGIDFRRD